MNDYTIHLHEILNNLLHDADFDGVIDTCKPALLDARSRHDQHAEILILNGLAWANLYLGKFRDARIYGDGALKLARQIGAETLVTKALNTSGMIHLMASLQPDSAEVDFRMALNLAHEEDDELGVIESLIGMGLALNKQGERDRAMRYAREGFEKARDAHQRLWMVQGLSAMGDIHGANGQYEIALKCYEDAVAIIQSDGYRLFHPDLIRVTGRLLVQYTRYIDEGMELLAKALEESQARRSLPQEYATLSALGQTFLEGGAFDRAQETFDQMLQLSQARQARAYEGSAFYDLGVLATVREEHDLALAHFEQALSISHETKNPYASARIDISIAQVASLTHDYDRALEHYQSARQIYHSLDDGAKAREVWQVIILTYVLKALHSLLKLLGLRGDS